MIYVFMADGTEEVEALAPIDVLIRGGFNVKTVGVTGLTVTTSHNIKITCDCTVDNLEAENIEAIIIPGGMPGTINIENSAKVHKIIDKAAAEDKLICAICAAPSVLGHKHLLEDKYATAFPGFEKDLYGAKSPVDNYVVKDGNIITARGVGVALEFGLKILEALTDSHTAAETAAAMQCR